MNWDNSSTAPLSSDACKKGIARFQALRKIGHLPRPIYIVHPEILRLMEENGYGFEDAICKFYLGEEPTAKEAK